jgi:hypothetical protein
MATLTNGDFTMTYFETMHEKEQDGFTIRLSVAPEDHPIEGGCCYESVQAFVDEGGYYQDMVDAVILEAGEMIEELSA